ncbi:MAG: 50S ribosomal protein L15 [bacterium]|nr:50S ribosomal protein L15 [bacterium]
MAEKDIKLELNNLAPAPGSTKKVKRLGRGTAAGQGRTCGKGHKGAKARAGYSYKAGFEGGQMPIQRRLPKRGFRNYPFRKIYQIVNLNRLTEVFTPGDEINPETLNARGLARKKDVPIKLLGDGDVKAKYQVSVHAVSRSAQEKVVAAGGEVHLIC